MRGWLSTEYRAVSFRREAPVVAYALFRNDEWNRIYLRQFFVVRDARRQGVGRAAVTSACCVTFHRASVETRGCWRSA